MIDDLPIPNPETPEAKEPTEALSAPGEPAAPTATRSSHLVAPPPPIKLGVYEGPLDLLLDLIRKQQINIYDIPIAKITQQYLDYLHLMKELNIDVAGEFIFMAATLIYIKSRTLLPPDPTAPPEELEDPRTELVQRLLEHEQFKNAAEMLNSKRLLEDAMWSQPGIGEFAEAEDEPGFAVSIFDLISVFRQILDRAKKKPLIMIRREEVSVAKMVDHVKQVLRSSPGPVSLSDLIGDFVWRQALIAIFLALLEMVRLRAIRLQQKDTFTSITVARSKRFEEVFAAKSAEELAAGLDESFT
ncbi:MAG: segregation/condensation protein A [Acidobacteriota bacterium]|nr:segregation/condensation protein A [Acidobacteriota bacterium]